MSHLLAFLQPDETAAELIARTHVEPISTGLFFASTLRPGQVLEICGSSGAAKSEVLTQVLKSARSVSKPSLHQYVADSSKVCRLSQHKFCLRPGRGCTLGVEKVTTGLRMLTFATIDVRDDLFAITLLRNDAILQETLCSSTWIESLTRSDCIKSWPVDFASVMRSISQGTLPILSCNAEVVAFPEG
jgi:ABC-type phosphonate transport system ATPase subunit